MQRRKVLTEDGTDDRRCATAEPEKASMVSTDDPVIKGLDFDSSTGEEKPGSLPACLASSPRSCSRRGSESTRPQRR